MSSVKQLLDALLWDIYGRVSTRNCNTPAGRVKLALTNEESDAGWKYTSKLLMQQNICALTQICASLRIEIRIIGSYLERALIARDKIRRRHELLCDIIDCLLQEISEQFGEPSKEMRFRLSPPPPAPPPPPPTDATQRTTSTTDGKMKDISTSDYTQWLHAMKMVARLPGGMPPEFRRKLWFELADKYLQSQKVDWEREQVKCFSEKWREDDEELGIQIVKDLHRTGSSLCSGPAGTINQAKLKRILLGYARYNPEVGYCQGFNMLGALILQVMDKDEVESIKVMIYLVEGIIPPGYFSGSLGGLQADMAVFREIMTLKLPKLAKHLQRLQGPVENAFEPPLTNVFTMQWFLTMFCTCLPMPCVLRVWDLVLIEGSDVLLRTALAIWSLLEERILNVRTADDFYCKMGALSGELLNGHLIDSNGLIEKVIHLGPIPELQKLRDKHLYNISPWREKTGLKLYYSDEEPDSDEDSRLAVTTAWGLRLTRRGSAGLPASSKPAADSRDRIALDISLLKKQYDRLRERQRQAHIIITSAVARQTSNSQPSSSIPVNQLLMGRQPIVTKGRRLGPPKGAIPPPIKISIPKSKSSSAAAPVTKPAKRGETLYWRDTDITKKRKGSIKWKDTNVPSFDDESSSSETHKVTQESPAKASEKSQKTSLRAQKRSDSSSYSEDSDANSSTSTSLCDEDENDHTDLCSSIENSPLRKKKESKEVGVPEIDTHVPVIELQPITDDLPQKKMPEINEEEEDSSTESDRFRSTDFSNDLQKLLAINQNILAAKTTSEDISASTNSPSAATGDPQPSCDYLDIPSNALTITSTSQLSPIADISKYLSNSSISPLRTPTSFFDYSSLLSGNESDANEEGVTNEYFERVIVERPTHLELLYSLNDSSYKTAADGEEETSVVEVNEDNRQTTALELNASTPKKLPTETTTKQSRVTTDEDIFHTPRQHETGSRVDITDEWISVSSESERLDTEMIPSTDIDIKAYCKLITDEIISGISDLDTIKVRKLDTEEVIAPDSNIKSELVKGPTDIDLDFRRAYTDTLTGIGYSDDFRLKTEMSTSEIARPTVSSDDKVVDKTLNQMDMEVVDHVMNSDEDFRLKAEVSKYEIARATFSSEDIIVDKTLNQMGTEVVDHGMNSDEDFRLKTEISRSEIARTVSTTEKVEDKTPNQMGSEMVDHGMSSENEVRLKADISRSEIARPRVSSDDKEENKTHEMNSMKNFEDPVGLKVETGDSIERSKKESVGNVLSPNKYFMGYSYSDKIIDRTQIDSLNDVRKCIPIPDNDQGNSMSGIEFKPDSKEVDHTLQEPDGHGQRTSRTYGIDYSFPKHEDSDLDKVESSMIAYKSFSYLNDETMEPNIESSPSEKKDLEMSSMSKPNEVINFKKDSPKDEYADRGGYTFPSYIFDKTEKESVEGYKDLDLSKISKNFDWSIYNKDRSKEDTSANISKIQDLGLTTHLESPSDNKYQPISVDQKQCPILSPIKSYKDNLVSPPGQSDSDINPDYHVDTEVKQKIWSYESTTDIDLSKAVTPTSNYSFKYVPPLIHNTEENILKSSSKSEVSEISNSDQLPKESPNEATLSEYISSFQLSDKTESITHDTSSSYLSKFRDNLNGTSKLVTPLDYSKVDTEVPQPVNRLEIANSEKSFKESTLKDYPSTYYDITPTYTSKCEANSNGTSKSITNSDTESVPLDFSKVDEEIPQSLTRDNLGENIIEMSNSKRFCKEGTLKEYPSTYDISPIYLSKFEANSNGSSKSVTRSDPESSVIIDSYKGVEEIPPSRDRVREDLFEISSTSISKFETNINGSSKSSDPKTPTGVSDSDKSVKVSSQDGTTTLSDYTSTSKDWVDLSPKFTTHDPDLNSALKRQSMIAEKSFSLDDYKPDEEKLEVRPMSCPEARDTFSDARLHSDRVLKIIEENSQILYRILKKATVVDSEPISPSSNNELLMEESTDDRRADTLNTLSDLKYDFSTTFSDITRSTVQDDTKDGGKSQSHSRPQSRVSDVSLSLRSDENIADRLASIKNTIKSIDSLCEDKGFRAEKCQKYIDSLFEENDSKGVEKQPTTTPLPFIQINDTLSERSRSFRDLKRESSPRRRRDEDKEEYASRARRDTLQPAISAENESDDNEVDAITSKDGQAYYDRPISPYYSNMHELTRSTTPTLYTPTKLQIRHTTVTSTFYDRYLTQKELARKPFRNGCKSPISPVGNSNFLDPAMAAGNDRNSKSAENSPSRTKVEVAGEMGAATTPTGSAYPPPTSFSTILADSHMHIRSCDNILLQLRSANSKAGGANS